jgi:hypothetical protein
MSSLDDPLTAVIRDRATAEGRTWACELRAALAQERRRTSGGWPGTMTEARARVAASVLPWTIPPGQISATEETRESAARLLYASARKAWLSNVEPDREG